MDRYFKIAQPNDSNIESSSSSNKTNKVNLSDLPWDPSERKPIVSYLPNQRDEVIRAYLIRGPCQPTGHDFPQTDVSGKLRRFCPDWYKQQHGNWLEYSVKTDKVYCLHCYLFKESGQNDAFVGEGVRCWHRIKIFEVHVGDSNSFHNRARKKGEDLLRQAQSIQVALEKQSDKQRKEYRLQLSTSVVLAKGLLNGGLPFRGHDESEESLYRGHFIEFLKLLGEINEEIGKVILRNAPGNRQMISPSIQKDICNCFAQEVLKRVFEELGDDVFSLLVDESSDVSKKEQMAVVLRFVDKLGLVKDKFMYELGHYITNVKEDIRFDNLNGLSLVLPVATAGVERCFSSMKHLKTELRNRMGDGYMNDVCICYIEREFLQQVSVEDVMQRFQKMKARTEQL